MRLEQILRAQYRVIGRGQARACGMTDRMLAHRLRAGGPWRKLLPGIYLTVTGVATVQQREVAALLHAGPGSMLTGLAAARRWGISVPGQSMVDVLVPATAGVSSTSFVRVQRTGRMPVGYGVEGPIRFAPPPRAVADAARTVATARDARALVAQAIQRDLCPMQSLATELEEGPVRGSAPLRAALVEARAGIRSVTEGDFRTLLQRGKIPMPQFNARLYVGATLLAVPDAWWKDVGVAAEVDSQEYHYRREDWQRTMQRHDRLVAHGVLLLHFTPRKIRTNPAEVVAQVRAALDAGRGRPPLAITTRPAA